MSAISNLTIAQRCTAELAYSGQARMLAARLGLPALLLPRQKSQNFPTPGVIYRVNLRHCLPDPYQITDEHYCFRFCIFLPHYE